MGKWLRRLKALPELLAAYAILRADIEETLANQALKIELDRLKNDPSFVSLIPRISAEWRALEQAINEMK